MTKIKRIAPGIYEIHTHGRIFQIEDWKDGTWLVFEMVGADNMRRDFMQDYMTLRAAKASLTNLEA